MMALAVMAACVWIIVLTKTIVDLEDRIATLERDKGWKRK
jgi:hypothetical protein